MARPRRQEHRRSQLVEATARAVATRGLAGLRLRDIAQEAGCSVGSVLYYYPDLDALLAEVHAQVLEVFYWARVRATSEVRDAPGKLVVAVEAGVPSSSADVTVRAIYQLHAAAARSPAHAELMATLWEREVSLFASILAEGARSGDFQLAGDPASIAQTVVALEDAFDLHLTSDNRAIDRATALDRILGYLSLATGCPLSVAPAPSAEPPGPGQ